MTTEHLPSEAEIRQRCREIQASWTEKEERMRAGAFAPHGWMPPVIRTRTGALVSSRLVEGRGGVELPSGDD